MHRLRFLLSAFAVICVLALPVRASPIVAMTLVGTVDNTQNANGDYIGPYLFSYEDTNGQTKLQLMVCVDDQHNISIGETWNAYWIDKSDLSDTGWGANADQIFGELAWLTNKVQNGYDTGNVLERIDNQNEAWAVLDSHHTLTASQSTDLTAVEAMDLTNYGTNSILVLPVGPDGQAQMFTTPEPPAATLLAGGAGLLLISALAKRRRLKG